MKYFDFNGLEHKAENLEIFLLVGLVYIIILAASWVYNRLAS